ncbi:hypothetical protein IWW50_002352, partial [Coemansia erecta]
MYKQRCLALLPLLAFAFAAVSSEYRDESISDSASPDIPDSMLDSATEVNYHIRHALDDNQRALLSGILSNIPGITAATPTSDSASADQVDAVDRHGHHKHHGHHGHHGHDGEDSDDEEHCKKHECCHHKVTPTYH